MAARVLFLLVFAAFISLSSDEPAQAEFAREWFRVPTKTEDPLFDEATLKRLYATQVYTNWNNIDIQAALSDLAAQCKTGDPAHIGFKFTLTKLPKKRLVYDRNGGGSAMGAILTFVLENDLTIVKIHKGEVILTAGPALPPL